MAKFEQRIRAREMRNNGEAITVIARHLNVSRSSVSLWCEDIRLSFTQIAVLKKNKGFLGRLRGAQMQHERKVQRIAYWKEQGIKSMKAIKKKELFFIGLGLYLGEGSKDFNKFQFTNSNPAFVKIMIQWLRDSFEVAKEDLYCHILINEIHANRTDKVEQKWIEILGISKDQFRKTILLKTKNKKVYENHDEYLGTLVLRVRRSFDLQRRILGLMAGVIYNTADKSPT